MIKITFLIGKIKAKYKKVNEENYYEYRFYTNN